ncbi:DUF2683 family protein [archaeon]|nr:DUF2683 family protein [archaeon]
MVKAIVNLDEHANRVINIVKAKYSLNDKSEAINIITRQYEEEVLEPELRPEFVEKLKKIEKQPTKKIKNFAKEFDL